MLKDLHFNIFELQEPTLPVRLINTTNERRLVQGHETTPLRMKRDIEDVCSVDNWGQRGTLRLPVLSIRSLAFSIIPALSYCESIKLMHDVRLSRERDDAPIAAEALGPVGPCLETSLATVAPSYNVEEERAAADRRTRGNSSTNYDGHEWKCLLLSDMNGHVGLVHLPYGEEVMSCQMIGRWYCMLEDEGRSEYPSTSMIENNIAHWTFTCSLKKVALTGRNFQNNAEVERAVRPFFTLQGTGFY
ncbi:hypothetical protein TNCV_1987611 [Trichonephila clavipes]|nr:hypothetical protein TNCV_1987611 [Trichonephila clavipes]